MKQIFIVLLVLALTACSADMNAAPQMEAVRAVYREVNHSTLEPATLIPTSTAQPINTPTVTATPTMPFSIQGTAYALGDGQTHIHLFIVENSTFTKKLTRLFINGTVATWSMTGELEYDGLATGIISVEVGNTDGKTKPTCTAEIQLSDHQKALEPIPCMSE